MKKNKSTIAKIFLGSSVILTSYIIISKKINNNNMDSNYKESTNVIQNKAHNLKCKGTNLKNKIKHKTKKDLNDNL